MSTSADSMGNDFSPEAIIARTQRVLDFYIQPRAQWFPQLCGTIEETTSHLIRCHHNHEEFEAHIHVPSSNMTARIWRIGETLNTVNSNYDRWFLGHSGELYIAVSLYGANEQSLCVKQIKADRLKRRTATFIFMNLMRISDHS